MSGGVGELERRGEGVVLRKREPDQAHEGDRSSRREQRNRESNASLLALPHGLLRVPAPAHVVIPDNTALTRSKATIEAVFLSRDTQKDHVNEEESSNQGHGKTYAKRPHESRSGNRHVVYYKYDCIQACGA